MVGRLWDRERTAGRPAEDRAGCEKQKAEYPWTGKEVSRQRLPPGDLAHSQDRAESHCSKCQNTQSNKSDQSEAETLERMHEAMTHGIPHNVLNAKFHEKEAIIIAEAGRKGAVTIATNMAGRGVDILLGGKPGGRKTP